MMGGRACDRRELFVCGSLRDLVPDDRIPARADRVLDLGWLRAEVRGLYAPGIGRPGIDPEGGTREKATTRGIAAPPNGRLHAGGLAARRRP